MYKVLIVDDERLAREGIRDAVDWEKLGAVVSGLAKNGLEAQALFRRDRPEIVITDIKMPGMNGLELMAKIREESPETQFIVLSGYEEFEYAKTAMQYGVKYYLLKPCNEEKIYSVLQDVIVEIDQRRAKEAYLRRVREDFERILPHLKGQILREFATNAAYGRAEWEYYRDLFQLDLAGERVRLIAFQLEGEFDFRSLFALKQIAEDSLAGETANLSTILSELVLVLFEDRGMEAALDLAKKVKRTFREYCEGDLTIAISEAGGIESLPMLFRETREYLKYRFYLGEGSIITEKDVGRDATARNLVYDFDQAGTLAGSGDVAGVRREIDAFFARLRDLACDFGRAKTYCLELFMALIRQSAEDKLEGYLKRLLQLESLDTLEQIRRCLREIGEEIAEANYLRTASRHSGRVKEVIRLVHEHLDKEELSLKWLAKSMLYMNVDYLGKLFKQEMDERFSDYVLRMRMERAKELLADAADYKIFEVAAKVGFGKNTQYFSQAFKKYLGCTPTEYKKSLAAELPGDHRPG